MISKKTIKINDDTIIIFTFYKIVINIDIYINTTVHNILRSHSEFQETMNELQNDYAINSHQIELIQKWYEKNYKKVYPITNYITKYGRKIIQTN